MWLCLNDAFFSIVDPGDAAPPGSNGTCLLVRARIKGDLERYFPEAEILEDAGTDYRYRVIIKRAYVYELVTDSVTKINYTNFKDSVDSNTLLDLYHQFWDAAWSVQEKLRNALPTKRI